MCLGGGGSRAPIYNNTYMYPDPVDNTIPTPEAPPPVPETENPSAESDPKKDKKDDTTTQGGSGHTGSYGGSTGSGTSGEINVKKKHGGSIVEISRSHRQLRPFTLLERMKPHHGTGVWYWRKPMQKKQVTLKYRGVPYTKTT